MDNKKAWQTAILVSGLGYLTKDMIRGEMNRISGNSPKTGMEIVTEQILGGLPDPVSAADALKNAIEKLPETVKNPAVNQSPSIPAPIIPPAKGSEPIDIPSGKYPLYASLIPKVRNSGFQGIATHSPTVFDTIQDIGNLKKDLRIDRFVRDSNGNWNRTGGMSLIGSGAHGVNTQSYFGKVRIVIGSTAVALPFVDGKKYTKAEALQFKVKFPPKRFSTNKWVQGTVYHNGISYELLGNPWKKAGSTRPENQKTTLQFFDKNGKKVKPNLTLDMLGRNTLGNPIDGRLEAQGMDRLKINDKWYLVIMMNVGLNPKYYALCYLYELPN